MIWKPLLCTFNQQKVNTGPSDTHHSSIWNNKIPPIVAIYCVTASTRQGLPTPNEAAVQKKIGILVHQAQTTARVNTETAGQQHDLTLENCGH